MNAVITQWINDGSDYSSGVRIYEDLGNDNFLKRIFIRGESTFNKKKLTEALQALIEVDPELADQQPAELEQQVQRPDPVVPNDNYSSGEIEVFGGRASGKSELMKVIKQIDANYVELRGLHPYLSILPEGDELFTFAQNISMLGKRNAELWDRRNHWHEHDHEYVAPEPAKPVMIDLNLLNQRESIRKSLNKAQNRLKKQNPAKPFTLALVDQRTKELAEIDEKIDAIKQIGGSDE